MEQTRRTEQANRPEPFRVTTYTFDDGSTLTIRDYPGEIVKCEADARRVVTEALMGAAGYVRVPAGERDGTSATP